MPKAKLICFLAIALPFVLLGIAYGQRMEAPSGKPQCRSSRQNGAPQWVNEGPCESQSHVGFYYTSDNDCPPCFQRGHQVVLQGIKQVKHKTWVFIFTPDPGYTGTCPSSFTQIGDPVDPRVEHCDPPYTTLRTEDLGCCAANPWV